jgi:hypothetical protein
MLRQVAMDYHFGLADLKAINEDEIRFFYDGLRYSLQRATAPQKKK